MKSMQLFITSTPTLCSLSELIKEKIESLATVPISKTTESYLPLNKRLKKTASEVPKKVQVEAVKKIQHVWRMYKIKEALRKDMYRSYLSFFHPKEECALTSKIMFGQCQTTIQSTEAINNPFPAKGYAGYHRHLPQLGSRFEALLEQFGVGTADDKELHINTYFFVTKLTALPVQDIIDSYCDYNFPIKIIENKSPSLALVIIPNQKYSWSIINEIKTKLRATGLMATPWSIACSIKKMDRDSLPTLPSTTHKFIMLQHSLPRSIKALLSSRLYSQLQMSSMNKKYPTYLLAFCLTKLLQNVPFVSPESTQRIALIIDLANTFYRTNYPKYALCVSTVIHEISLTLLRHTDIEYLKASFSSFLVDAKNIYDVLGLEEKTLSHSTFIAIPTISGMNALAIAHKIAAHMITATGKEPRFKMCKACYYEFTDIINEDSTEDPDIFVFSAGPIVTHEGILPGLDINRFIQQLMLSNKLNKPLALIIDTTTALYKNLKVDTAIKNLMEQGKLSLFIVESHQKFGLLHSDQAQSGRLIGICAKGTFRESLIRNYQNKAQLDFNKQIDMRVDAYIHAHCRDALEKIKQNHFRNGALMRDILIKNSLLSEDVIKHENMLNNMNELYFIDARYKSLLKSIALDHINKRQSFGHFAYTQSLVGGRLRISANASDAIDCLIKTTQLHICLLYNDKDLIDLVIENSRVTHPMPIHHQIIVLAIINCIINENYVSLIEKMIYLEKFTEKSTEKRLIIIYIALSRLINQCSELKGRDAFSNARIVLDVIKNYII